MTVTLNSQIGNTASLKDGSATLRYHKLADAAEQFEAMLLQQILKPLQESVAAEKGDGASMTDTDTMTAYATEAVAGVLAKSGGLGLARQILKHLANDASISEKA